LGLAIATTLLCFSILLSWIVGGISESQIKADSGKFMEQLAYQMTVNLDQDMFVYFREIQILANLDVIQDPNELLSKKRDLLNQLKAAYSNYAWIGLTDAKGIVLASTGGLLEGVNVADRPWFAQSQQQSTVQDVHGAKLLAQLLPNPDPTGEPLRFVDVAAPVFNQNHEFVGVLGGHLYWQWAAKVRDDLLQPLQDYRAVQVLILSSGGDLLLAPTVETHPQNPNLSDFNAPGFQLKNLPSFKVAQVVHRGSIVEVDLNSRVSYLTGYAKSQGYNDYLGLGWVTLVRQSTNQAFATARSLRQTIIIWGLALGFLGGLLAWWIARSFVTPLMQIATTADRIRNGDSAMTIPIFLGTDEVGVLSRAVAQLVTNLEQQKQELITLNLELEERVQIRTATLDDLNRTLTKEIGERKLAEMALQLANESLQRLSLVDSLTGIANRRRFDDYLSQEWQRLAREKLPLSLILIDVDYFKWFNDRYGHQAGDRCLQQVALALSQTVNRSVDLVARYGGEEFVAILPNSDNAGATYIAEAMRQAVKTLAIPHEASEISPYLTISVGVGTIIPCPEGNPIPLIKLTDQLLYQAKTQGRDQVMSQAFDSALSR
jgi:diguanylate cyclase